jgi:hypothetical protein
MATMQIEKRKRGIFGWIVAIVFWGFNIFMAAWVATYWGLLGTSYESAGDAAAQAGTAIGGAIGTGMLFSLWFFGAVILGIMMLFTRGKKVIISQEVPSKTAAG